MVEPERATAASDPPDPDKLHPSAMNKASASVSQTTTATYCRLLQKCALYLAFASGATAIPYSLAVPTDPPVAEQQALSVNTDLVL